MKDRLAIAAAWLLPHRLAYWAFVRVAANATMPPYGDQVVPALTCIDAMGRWS
jgi:hypothetical protein